MKKRSKILISCLMMVILAAAMMTGCSKKKEAKPEPVRNPLTGSEKFDSAAQGIRPVALVVENAPDARPQWGMTDKKYSPDIILQGEVEGGITRTLWFYADYNKLPKKIGPMRSARPPYIKFSELFDAIFIHWGQSSSSSEYKGANTVFKEDKVDHINQMTYKGKVDLYSRDNSRDVSSEHTGILHGDKVADAEARIVGIGQNDKSLGGGNTLEHVLQLFIPEDSGAVGRQNRRIDEVCQPRGVVFSLHQDGLFQFQHQDLPASASSHRAFCISRSASNLLLFKSASSFCSTSRHFSNWRRLKREAVRSVSPRR